MKIDIGTITWNNGNLADQVISNIRNYSAGEWRLFVIDNASTNPHVREVIDKHSAQDSRIIPIYNEENLGYAKAVNQLLKLAETQYVAYMDHDCRTTTLGWNTQLCHYLDFHEVGMSFPGTYVNYPITRPSYKEILWGVGCCWALKRARAGDVGYFDEEIGHQEEVDFQYRLRLAGWKIVGADEVRISHDGAASSNTTPENQARIDQGVRNWVNKYNSLLLGPNVNYYSSNVWRYENWPVTAAYMEEYFQQYLPANLNDNCEKIVINGKEWELVKVPRWPGFYRNRTI